MIFETFSEIKARIKGYIRSRLGYNFNLNETEPGGQLHLIGSSQASDMQDKMIDVYNANTIFCDEEQDQDIQLLRRGTKRLTAKAARIYEFKCVCSGAVSLTEADSRFQTESGILFKPIQDYSLSSGTQRITIIAVETGSIEISESDINTITTPVSNLDSVENDSSSIFQNGRNIETLEEARARMDTFQNSYEYTENAIKKALEDLSYVIRATPIESKTNNTIELVVEQADLSDAAKDEVCQVIAFAKGGGIPAVSSASGENKVEREIQIGDNSKIIVQYSLPTEKEMYCRLTLEPTLSEAEEDSLSDYIEEWSSALLAGETLIPYGSRSILKACIDWAGKTFTDIKVEISSNGTDWTEDNIETTALEVVRIPAENVSYL